jgi:tetratricopeptide (TPR) repeat protein
MIQLGKELMELGKLPQALEVLQKAMSLAPQSAEAKQQTAYCNYLMKNYPGAVTLYNAALLYDRANPMIYKRLGLAYRDMGDMIGARNSFAKYLEMEPDAPDKSEFERFIH